MEPSTPVTEPGDVIVFDLETTELIPKARDEVKRLEGIRALTPSVICAYSQQANEYSFFTETTIADFLRLLAHARTVVGFNLLDFDYEVLAKYGLPSGVQERTVDLFALIRDETGNWYSLDRLAKQNLGRGKRVKGKAMPSLRGVDLYEGCRGDVEITKALFDRYWQGTLQYDRHPWARRKQPRILDEDEEDEEAAGENLGFTLYRCPHCGSLDLEEFEEDTEDMTEGQFADYLAGSWGTVYCGSCGAMLDYDELVEIPKP